jgi:hypothetical protein
MRRYDQAHGACAHGRLLGEADTIRRIYAPLNFSSITDQPKAKNRPKAVFQ